MRNRGSKKNYFLGFIVTLAIFLPLIVIYFQQKPVYKAHAQTATAAVDIVDFMFSPATITVAAGTTITWTNMSASGSDHTTTSNIAGTVNSWDSGLTTPGQTFSFTFSNPGTYDYHCNVHTFMMGTVIVTAGGTTTAPTATTAPAAPTATTAPAATAVPTTVAISVPTDSEPSPTPDTGTVTATPTTTTTTTTTGDSSLQSILLSIITLLLKLIQSLFGNL
jgi:plastocyanin